MKKFIAPLAAVGAAAAIAGSSVAVASAAPAAPVAKVTQHQFVYAAFPKLSVDRLNQLAGNGWVLVSGHVASHDGAVKVVDVLLRHLGPLR